MSLPWLLRAAGAVQLLLAAAHLAFPGPLRWREELAQLSLLNRQIFQVHTLFVCLTITLIGILSLRFPETLLLPSPLARLVLDGCLAFWCARLAVQWLVFRAELWRGHGGRTLIQWLLTVLWAFLAGTYGACRWHLG